MAEQRGVDHEEKASIMLDHNGEEIRYWGGKSRKEGAVFQTREAGEVRIISEEDSKYKSLRATDLVADIDVDIDVDTSEAVRNLKGLQRLIREITQDLRELEKAADNVGVDVKVGEYYGGQ